MNYNMIADEFLMTT